ncbi:BatA domain-containing protein [Flavobacterium rhizosphaerae]|uniref:BatA domain-containing protein n=1 Tax=Flavobacterium rhizosphaerae TaxID=3163298 RepID=A0ABW8YUS6_9FLAO
MQFKHPEILYFLFLLVIPVLVHLFQLRRFKKEYFTNVRFLRELSIQTRKSSQLKKWLLLFTRLFLLACLIIAFAQPFFKAEDSEHTANEMVILLDNSFSMQAKGNRGELLKRAVQDLLENIPDEKQFSLITNTNAWWHTDIKSVQKDLQNITYTDAPFRPEFLLTKAEAKSPGQGKDIVLITDAVNLETKDINFKPETPVYAIIPQAENIHNIAVDSVYISQVMDNFYEIKAHIQTYGSFNNDVPVALYDNGNLTAKSVIKFTTASQSATFTIAKKEFNGYVAIEDNSLPYDNYYYFSISQPEKVNVIAVGTEENNKFLSRIYTDNEFNFINTTLSNLDYNSLQKQDIIILNEPAEISQALVATLKDFYTRGGNLIIIPGETSGLQNLNNLLGSLGNEVYKPLTQTKRLINKISFSHPLYQEIFEKKVDNFQYPEATASYTLSGMALPMLTYDDGTPFLASLNNNAGNAYIFAAPLTKSNFKQNLDLVVPTFYGIGLNSNKTGINAINIGQNQSILLNAALSKDEVITVKNNEGDFIPMQQILNDKVKISFGQYPETAGNYGIYQDNENLKNISFNYARTESDLTAQNKNVLDDYTKASSIDTVYNDIASVRTAGQLWKWFIIGTLIFLLLELFIQKFVK